MRFLAVPTFFWNSYSIIRRKCNLSPSLIFWAKLQHYANSDSQMNDAEFQHRTLESAQKTAVWSCGHFYINNDNLSRTFKMIWYSITPTSLSIQIYYKYVHYNLNKKIITDYEPNCLYGSIKSPDYRLLILKKSLNHNRSIFIF